MMHEEQKEKKLQERLGSAIWFFVFCSYHTLIRLLGDEIKLRSFNKKLPESKRQGGTAERRGYIAASLGIITGQVGLLYLLATGFGTRGNRSPLELIDMMTRARRLPTADEIFNSNIAVALVCSIVISNIIYYTIYKMKKSKLIRFMDAMKASGIVDNEAHTDKIWYYPDRLACLPLVGTTGEELLKNVSLWNLAKFQPSVEVKELPGNVYLFVGKKQKPSNSTLLYERYDEWTELMNNRLKRMNWQLGEYVEKDEYKWKDMSDNSTLAFIGMTGSGKTEAMRIAFAAVKIMHPDMRFIIHDPKAAGDWDPFAPFTELGRVLKTPEEGALGFFYAKSVLAARVAYCQEKGYSNITDWMQKENVVVPILMLIVDEFPNFNKAINFDFNYKKPNTAAGILFELFTMGRSYGIWFTLGSQFGLGEHVPSEVNKNTKVHICLRVGSHGESSAWIDSDAAFKLGKGTFLENGDEDPQSGYAYIDDIKEHVRFWYADNLMLYHEFLKYQCPVVEGFSLKKAEKLGVPRPIAKKINALKEVGKSEKDLPGFERRQYDRYQAAKASFEANVKKMEEANAPIRRLVPLASAWTPGEDPIAYADRSYREALQKLGIPHRYTQLFPGIAPPRPPVTAAPTPPPPSPAPAPSTSRASSVKADPEIKRPSLDDIFKSLAATEPKDKK